MLVLKWTYPNGTWHQTHLTTWSAASSDYSSKWCTQGNIMIWLQRMLTRSTLRRKPVISCRRTRLLRRFDPTLPPFPHHLDLFVVARSATGQTGSCKKIQSIRVNALKPTNTPPPRPSNLRDILHSPPHIWTWRSGSWSVTSIHASGLH